MIEAYMRSLEAELRVPRRARSRILAEARDHLHEAVASGLERGLPAQEAEHQAIASFGDARELAAGFHVQLASTSAHGASARAALLALGMVALLGAGSPGPLPTGLVIFMAGQLAVVAAVLGVARSLRYRGARVVPAARLPDLYRANAVAAGAGAVAALVYVVGAATSGFTVASAAGSAALLAMAGAAAWAVVSLRARGMVLAPAAAADEDALDDLQALLVVAMTEARRRAPGLAARGERAVSAAWRSVRGPARRLHLRRHPWRFCAAFALVCGGAVAAGHGIFDGGPSLTARALLAGVLIASIEAAMVALCFLMFGRFLGVRR